MSSELKVSCFERGFSSIEEAESTGIVGWGELVTEGYGFSSEQLMQQFEIEYTNLDRGVIIAAVQGKRVIATLVVNRSGTFSEYLAYGVHGIVIASEYRKRGIGTLLYRELLGVFHPDLIIGSTKTPSAVMARAKSTSDMRTFYGYYETTSEESFGYTCEHEQFLLKSLAGREGLDFKTATFLKSTDILPPDSPLVGGYPEYIQKAFLPVVERQTLVGSKMTVVMPLLSIKEHLLDS